MTAQTLEQKRAKHALDQVKALLKDKPGNYLSYVNALPAAILMNGLGQALATERAASDPAHHQLAQHVSDWLLSPEAHTRYATPASDEAKLDATQRLLGRIVAGDQDAYLWAQTEAIAYVTWLKKFANAFRDPPRKE
ncbi:type III-B CRISPR module-associated protein Cmr5 [Bradyrhizobium sp.]|uniref:type III-B CRISPR module-associated protein Cmr5 n=1 Tax=Bradyrhizobium sp. TaxID=376 RepID=UPI002D5B721A|nr:type III-B CRISPR module-associated protein Cmr5 [Bradyrhizobium sp.]HZR74779.1 type III-B CRISPR module-associated protein Cmr5 [Bradyrhizobium sp.]